MESEAGEYPVRLRASVVNNRRITSNVPLRSSSPAVRRVSPRPGRHPLSLGNRLRYNVRDGCYPSLLLRTQGEPVPSRPPVHQPARAGFKAPRVSRSRRGYDRVWLALSARHRAEHPFCERCKAEGRMTPAEHTDHKVPFRGLTDPLRLDQANLQSLCARCHSRKTASEDGGFGLPVRGGGRGA